MPHRAGRVCPVIGCPNLVNGSERYCDEHKRARWQRQNATRGPNPDYGPAWQAISKRFLLDHPACCWPGCGRRSAVAHHRIEKKQGGGDGDDNLQALCWSHHSRAHALMTGGVGRGKQR
jgi:5-methylcytosine-specific restriction protein A